MLTTSIMGVAELFVFNDSLIILCINQQQKTHLNDCERIIASHWTRLPNFFSADGRQILTYIKTVSRTKRIKQILMVVDP